MKIINSIYGTTPSIFHAQGRTEFCPLWPDIKNYCQKTKKKVPKELKLLTFNNGKSFREKDIGCLEKTVQNCFVMGRNIKQWKNSMKIPLTVQFLEMVKTDFVMSFDSSDVAVLNLDILDLFFEKKCDMLFNAEKRCWPEDIHMKEKEEIIFLKPFCHLNAGAWIGHKEAALLFFKKCLEDLTEDESSEQFYIKRRYNDFNIKIDDKCSIFQTLNRVTTDELTFF